VPGARSGADPGLPNPVGDRAFRAGLQRPRLFEKERDHVRGAPSIAILLRAQRQRQSGIDRAQYSRVARRRAIIGLLAVIKPFTTAILFGAALATTAWPVGQALVRRGLGRGAAAAILLSLSLGILVLPMLLFAPHLADQLIRGAQRVQAYFAATPEQPTWMKGVPLLGQRLAAVWDRVVEAQGNIRTLIKPYTANLEQMMIGAARAF
jgi:AI-2E family transporter